jgi:hypothetical protein
VGIDATDDRWAANKKGRCHKHDHGNEFKGGLGAIFIHIVE